MFYGIGALLANYARESAQDNTSKLTYSVIHTVCCIGSTVQNLRVLSLSFQRTAEDVEVVTSKATAAVSQKRAA